MGAKNVEEHLNRLQLLPVRDIIPTLENPRQINTKDPTFVDLVKSVKGVGVIIPVHVRQHPVKKDKWDLRAGSRRYCAAIEAKLKDIPAIVHYGMTDEAAFELTFMENFSRADLTPLEQGAAVAILLERYHGDFRAVAGKLGWSETAVRRRARLTKLTSGWREELAHPKSMFENWTAGHMELIARYEPEQQDAWLTKWRKEAVKYGHNMHEYKTVHGLEQTLASDMRLLSKARWKLDDEKLVKKAGTCLACKKRTSCKPGLFDDGAVEPLSKDDKCVDAGCWKKKEKAWLKRRKLELREKHGEKLVAISTGHGSGKDTLSSWQYDKAKKGDKGAVPALVVNGDGLGQVQYVIPKKDHIDRSRASSKPTLKQLRDELKSRRRSEVGSRIEAHFATELPKQKKKYSAAAALPLHDVMVLAAVFGAAQLWGKHKLTLKQAMKLTDKELGQRLWKSVQESMYQEYWSQVDDVELVCKIAGVDYKAIVEQVKKDMPDPEEWKDLKADGTPKKKKATAKKKAKVGEDILEGELVELASQVSVRIGQDKDGWWYRLTFTSPAGKVIEPMSEDRYETRQEAEFDAAKAAIRWVRTSDDRDAPMTFTLVQELEAHLSSMNGGGKKKAGKRAAKKKAPAKKAVKKTAKKPGKKKAK